MARSKLSRFAMMVPMLGSTLAFSVAPVQPAHAQYPGDVAAGLIIGGVLGAFAYGGRNYCFYDNGWNGPGWYWCGDYAYRYGYGWGGPVGWNNWRWRGGVAPGYRHGWRGAPPHGWSGGPGQWNRPHVNPRPGGGYPGVGRPGGGYPNVGRLGGGYPNVGRPGGGPSMGARPQGGRPSGHPGGVRGGPPRGEHPR